MVVKPPAKKPRGKSIDLPDWWLKAVTLHTEGASLSELADELSKKAERDEPWSRETVGKFLKNDHATWELMEALSDHFDIPRAGYMAQSYEEADAYRAATRRFASNPELSSRRAAFDKAREGLARRLADQTKALDSGADVKGTKVRRRPRGMGRRGPSST